MKKLLFVILICLAGITYGQNNNENINPAENEDDNVQVAINNSNKPDNLNNNINAVNQSPQVVIQQQVSNTQQQAFNPYRGNVFQTNQSDNQQKTSGQHSWGQSIQPVSGGGGGYSGSSGGSSVKHKVAFSVKIKKAMSVFERKYKHPKHYAHKKRIRKCQTF